MNLFDKFDKLFQNEKLDRPPSSFMLNRFMASQRDFAPFAKRFSRDLRGDDVVFEVWRTSLPTLAEAPYLKYPAPGKSEEPSTLVSALMERGNFNRQQAEQAAELLELAGEAERVAGELGVELED